MLQILADSARHSSIAALTGVVLHYTLFFIRGGYLWPEAIAEWIMARTPSHYALWLLSALGAWAKPFAVTGGLAVLGFLLWCVHWAARPHRLILWPAGALVAWGLGRWLEYGDLLGQLSFWIPALAALALLQASKSAAAPDQGRRKVLSMASQAALPALMGGGTLAVAVESYLREQSLARRAPQQVDLFPFAFPAESFAPGLVRRAVTPTDQFYGMSKNAVDPLVDTAVWRLRITVDGKPLAEYRYEQLLALPRRRRYVTLRCVSNTLKSDLMGTAEWAGILLGQLVDRRSLPSSIREVAVIGVDGHGDSISLDYAFSDETMLALGMNGKTLNRTHGYPIRLLAPLYYGFKNVKWIGEIAFLSKPYYGTWPKMGYTKEPRIHTMSAIDRMQRDGEQLLLGGVAFAGSRGIRQVQVRAGDGAWANAELERPLSPYTWTRWKAQLQLHGARLVEARAQDGAGQWQATRESPLFPDGVKGPTIRRIS